MVVGWLATEGGESLFAPQMKKPRTMAGLEECVRRLTGRRIRLTIRQYKCGSRPENTRVTGESIPVECLLQRPLHLLRSLVPVAFDRSQADPQLLCCLALAQAVSLALLHSLGGVHCFGTPQALTFCLRTVDACVGAFDQ